MDIQKLLTTKMNRRRLLTGASVAGAGAVLTACGAPVMAKKPEKPDYDKAILNFALNLEYIEASFYLAAVGKTPSYGMSGTGTQGAVMGGSAVDFSNNLGGALSADFRNMVQAFATEIADDEENHVLFLRSALGADAVAQPGIDIGVSGSSAGGSAFSAAANAAASTTLNPPFSPYNNALYFLLGAFIFEDVGVTAYKGAAPLVANPDYLSAAAGIEAVEAYHASEIRTLLYQFKGAQSPYGLTAGQIVTAISDLRATLDGSGNGGHDQSIVVNGKANIVVSDDNGIAYGRTPREVLNIVFGAQGASKGLFFPAGVNGDFSALLKATS